jgi:NADPH:quinone reductase-like Zn-dependent oxidoreductase
VRASFRTSYGLPDVLSIKEVPKPVAKDNEVLVKVRAATVNRSDYHVLTGKPFIMKFFTGFGSPKLNITGSDFAGDVEAVGKDVKQFKVGDKVMGFIDMGSQSHAEYLSISEEKVTRAPNNLTYEQTVACLEGAFYALTAIRTITFKAGETALVIGGTGAIGSSYVQFLSHFGVIVTAVCGGENSGLVQSLGASKTIDYKKEDFRVSVEI